LSVTDMHAHMCVRVNIYARVHARTHARTRTHTHTIPAKTRTESLNLLVKT